jgi:hypothetical protein
MLLVYSEPDNYDILSNINFGSSYVTDSVIVVDASTYVLFVFLASTHLCIGEEYICNVGAHVGQISLSLIVQ